MTDHDWDVSERDVFDAMRTLRSTGDEAAVATIVDVEGSAYRRPGAKMVVEAGGGGRGQITAGCIEDEVLELVDEVLAAGEPRVETYDLMEDDDVWGLGLGCNGIIDVLVEPLDASIDPLIDAIEHGEPIGVITVTESVTEDGTELPVGARAYYRGGEIVEADATIPDWLLAEVQKPAALLVEQANADLVRIQHGTASAEVFIDGIQPAPRLVVIGSGHDVGPVVELGKKNGFRVEVVGFRGAVDLESRFPAADSLQSTRAIDLGDAIELDEQTYAVVMSHNFIDDQVALEQLIDAGVPYIGLMGPRDRFEEMREGLEQEGRTFDPQELDRIYTPVGLDLGAGSPYGIATSIVAEALAVHNDRKPVHLTEREGPIHERASIEATGTE